MNLPAVHNSTAKISGIAGGVVALVAVLVLIRKLVK